MKGTPLSAYALEAITHEDRLQLSQEMGIDEAKVEAVIDRWEVRRGCVTFYASDVRTQRQVYAIEGKAMRTWTTIKAIALKLKSLPEN